MSVPNQRLLEVAGWTVVGVSEVVPSQTTTCYSKATQQAVHLLLGVASGAVLPDSCTVRFFGLIHTYFRSVIIPKVGKQQSTWQRLEIPVNTSSTLLYYPLR